MEDGVTDIESLVFPKNSSPREEKNHRQERDESKGGEEQRTNGFITPLISDLDYGRREEEENQREKESSVSDGKEEETVGGMINNLISNWVVFPSSPKVGQPNKGKVDIVVVKEKEKIDSGGFKSENDLGGSGGGIISDLIGNVFHQNESQENEEETVQGLEGNGQVLKAEDEGGGGGGGGGGITDNIVSHLPASLADGVAPLETDEASILIHCVVHD